MTWMRRMLPVCFLLAVACLQGSLLLEAGPAEPRKPFFERFRRLEEQFRRFQEVTLMRLQSIAGNYNVSYNIDTRFQHLAEQYNGMVSALNESHTALQGDLDHLKIWMKKLQKKTRKLDLKISSLEESVSKQSQQRAGEKQQQVAHLTNLTLQVTGHKEAISSLHASSSSLQKELMNLQEASQSQATKLGALEHLLQGIAGKEALSPQHLPATQLLNQTAQGKQLEAEGSQTQSLKKLHTKHRQRKKLQEERQQLLAQSAGTGLQSSLLHEHATPLQKREPEPLTRREPQVARQQLSSVIKVSQEQKRPSAPKKPGTICNVGSMLLFPNVSTENFATLTPGFQASLYELSLCSWVSTPFPYLGTILSYAMEENDNKLVLHGRNARVHGSIHFVIGDPAFRELPVGQLLDSRWHHLCIIWSSVQGQYWFYVNRRLVSMGSKFQKGYVIPPGGSLILGQEQDVVGGGFDPSEAFVGRLAGLAIWNRALSPGEVSGIATGKGLPHGTILTLADISLHGGVQKVNCTCLEHCL
ncbi:pentraxin-4 [Alligator mississippiensis]|uniref:Pentraxin-4 n=1 Tax=Alligator mississippiensis TaxID=8496 RepID=A0A151NGL8_ALLMI|nr:pentraxin-4 [Alligator mississippiensis]KYO35953.1 pentraxin-4 [Alligator mississippiensis]